MPPTHDQEELLNGKLAELLREQGLDARAERWESGRRMDVVVDVEGARVVLEAETGVSTAKRKEAVGDADRRLRQGLTTVVFALCYPNDSTTDSLPDAKLIWAVRTRAELRGGAAARWSEPGDVPELAEAVRQAAATVGDADGAAQILSEALDAAVQRFSTVTRKQIAKALDLRAENAKDRKLLAPHQRETDGYFVATKRGMLVVATAMLFHHRLQEHLPPLHPSGYEGVWPPLNPSQCAAEPESTIRDFLEAWRAILAVDYRPVFETARVALMALPHTPDIAQAVFTLAGEVAKIAGLMHGLRHDLLGRIFHRVLDTARYDGSFYTSAAAATLLAGLAIRAEDHDWSSADAIAQLRICDPACGTGTLLIAAAARIEVLRRQAGPIDADDEEALALCLVEDVLWGYDINLTATHIAATALGMLSPTTKFERLRIYRSLLGFYEGKAYTGSMEILSPEKRMQIVPWPAPLGQMDTGVPDDPEPMDLVIMNPPFTRDSLKYDQFSAAEHQRLKDRDKEIVGALPDSAAARLSGTANGFVVLAERLASNRNSAVACVLPTVMATNPAALATRKFLARKFHIETIVSSHDPERFLMSENTTISEMLVVCRRHPDNEPKPPTRVVNLIENPPTSLAAGAVGTQIQTGDGPFITQHVDAEQIGRGDWYAVNFLSPFLVNEARRLRADAAGAQQQFIGMSRIAEVGPAGQRIRDAYTRHDKPTASGRRALWYHKTDVTQSMSALTDSFIEPKPPKRALADKYWDQRSELLLTHRLWLPLAQVCAVRLDDPAVGSMWTPCRPHDDDPATQAALCVYLNSSIGLLAVLGGRDNKKPSYPQFSLDTLRSIPVPNFPALGDDARDALADAYETLKNETLLPFPQMNDDLVRQQLDDAVTNALNLDPEWVAQIRRALSEEPSITNKRYAPLTP